MAFTLSTIYKAVDKHIPVVRKIEQYNTKFANRQDQLFKNLGKTFGNVKNQLIGLAGGISIASVLLIGGNAVVKYDEALQSLSAITGVTGKAFDGFKKEAMIVADQTKKSAVDVLKAFELVGSAKPELLANAQALGEVSKQAIILGRAGKLLPEDAVDALTISLNQFGAGAEKAAMFTDILATAQQKGSGTISYLSQAIVNAGGTMKAFGNSFEDTVSILEGFAKAGVPASEAGTMLSGIMAKLAKSSKKEFNPQFTKATDIINNLAKANLSYAQLMKLTDDRGAKWLTQIINQNSIVQQLSGNLNETGNAMSQANTMAVSFAEKLRELRARFENIIIKSNENSGALSRFGKIIDFVTKNLDKILKITLTVIGVFTAYYAIMTAIRLATIAYNVALGIFLAFQKAVPISLAVNTIALKAYTIATNIATVAMKLLSLAFKATPLGWIVLGIGVVIALFKHMAERWEGIKRAFKENGFLAGIVAVGKALLSFILKPIQWILKVVGKIPGMKWAQKASENIGEFRANLDKGLVNEKPVNIEKSTLEKNVEITKNILSIELSNRTDKKANVKASPAMIPLMSNTY